MQGQEPPRRGQGRRECQALAGKPWTSPSSRSSEPPAKCSCTVGECSVHVDEELVLSSRLEFGSFDLGCTVGVENKNGLVKNESLLLNKKIGA
jgi:hypothetical protein